MTPFLHTIAQHYYQTYGNSLEKICFIFPNRRSSLFFKKHLSTVCDKPIFAPDCMAINELFLKLSPLQQADDLGLIFTLYQHYIEIAQSSESFDEFYAWGETLLSDFNDIDKHLVNAEQLFSNLYELKSIDNTFDYLNPKQLAAIRSFWADFDPLKYSNSRRDFLQSWAALAPLYNTLRQDLLKKNQVYEGLIYRNIAENIKGSTLKELPYEKYVFIGLNILNECEKALLKHYQKLGMADFHWDLQSDFINDTQNKAGVFIRENLLLFPQSPKLDFEALPSTNYESIAIPSNTGQTKVISELLSERGITTQKQFDNTAIVLLDENLMVPLLHSLPDEVDAYNITMGYPLKASGIYTFFNQLLNLQKNKRISKEGTFFYHRNIISILRHSFLSKYFKEECQELINSLTKHKLIYASKQELSINPFFELIFSDVDKSDDLLLYLKRIFAAFLDLHKSQNEDDDLNKEKSKDDKLEKEFLYHLYITLSRIDDLVQENGVLTNMDTLMRLLRKHIEKISVPFYGEPLKGLQIMGILETRTLDFENIIFLSFNEGILPKTEASNSFIPHNLRYGFGLPTLEHQDAISAYYFYRITQRAKNVWMIYNTSNSGMKNGEISRYHKQLKYIYKQQIKERSQNYNVALSSPKPIIIKKDEKVLALLKPYTTENGRKLSASSLNNYIDCKLKFYFQNVEGIRQADELSETIEHSTFGTIFHYVAECLYKPYENAVITEELLNRLNQDDKKIEELINIAFAKELYHSEKVSPPKGWHLIIARIIKKYIKQLLTYDIKKTPFTYIKGEQKMNLSFEYDDNKKVYFTGSIDRIDEKDKKTQIIDYKTGKIKDNGINKFKTIEEEFYDYEKRKGAIFQTFLYAWMYQRSSKTRTIEPQIYYIQQLFKDFNPSILHDKTIVENYNDYAEVFETSLKNLLQEIFNPDIAFSQTENLQHCKYCDYKNFCLR